MQVTIVMGDHGPSRGPHKALQPFPFLSVTLSDDLAKAPGWKQYRDTLKYVSPERVLPGSKRTAMQSLVCFR